MPIGTIRTLFSGGTLQLLLHFVLHPEPGIHFRALRERLGLGTGALQRELVRLETLGLITRTGRDGRVYFNAVGNHPSWGAFRTLLREHADPADVLRHALAPVPGIRLAFVYGSTVRGDARSDSDIDVFIVEAGMPPAEIGRAATEAESLLGRPVDLRSYTPAKLAAKLEQGSAFLHDVLAGPKAWIIGSDELLSAAV